MESGGGVGLALLNFCHRTDNKLFPGRCYPASSLGSTMRAVEQKKCLLLHTTKILRLQIIMQQKVTESPYLRNLIRTDDIKH